MAVLTGAVAGHTPPCIPPERPPTLRPRPPLQEAVPGLEDVAVRQSEGQEHVKAQNVPITRPLDGLAGNNVPFPLPKRLTITVLTPFNGADTTYGDVVATLVGIGNT